MRTALIQNATVINVIEAPEGWQPPPGLLAVASHAASIGDGWDGDRFIPAPSPHTPTVAPIDWPSDGPPPPITFTHQTPAFKE